MLVPASDEREVLQALLDHRCGSLGIAKPRYQIIKHPRRDPGCFKEPDGIVELFRRTAAHLLILFDHEGSGQEGRPASDLAAEVKQRLEQRGWQARVEVLVIEPELEIWLWSPSPHVARALGWTIGPFRSGPGCANKGYGGRNAQTAPPEGMRGADAAPDPDAAIVSDLR